MGEEEGKTPAGLLPCGVFVNTVTAVCPRCGCRACRWCLCKCHDEQQTRPEKQISGRLSAMNICLSGLCAKSQCRWKQKNRKQTDELTEKKEHGCNSLSRN